MLKLLITDQRADYVNRLYIIVSRGSLASGKLKIPSEFEASSIDSADSLLWMVALQFFCHVKTQAQSWSC